MVVTPQPPFAPRNTNKLPVVSCRCEWPCGGWRPGPEHRQLGQVSPSLVKLVERVLGIRLLKGDQLTDWTRRPLSPGQLAYAAGDVAHLLELRTIIGLRLEEMGRTEWAEQEFSVLLSKDRSPTEASEAWWKLPRSRSAAGTGTRRRAERGVLA